MTTKQARPLGIAALAAIIAGVIVQFGAGWGLLVGGVLVLAATWTLWDPAAGQPVAQRLRPREARSQQ
ncbi:hypothetical protein H7J86_24510 [Mycobacterium hackensackense]|uniref:hypothetical protein n=1 Tax=Mycobacterium hackensackense TaxID=228909 RepID=UPI002265D810|nr:hypothetical protein [Mycobacterium hackensackense]MCV7255330.1 hypothetical protein [Mycobacterium hackensackense]